MRFRPERLLFKTGYEGRGRSAGGQKNNVRQTDEIGNLESLPTTASEECKSPLNQPPNVSAKLSAGLVVIRAGLGVGNARICHAIELYTKLPHQMSDAAFILLSLSGAVASVYLFGRLRQRMQTEQLIRQRTKHGQNLQSQLAEKDQFQEMENGLQQQPSTLEQLLRDHERKLMDAEGYIQTLRQEREQPEKAYSALSSQCGEVDRKIEDNREVPLLIFKDTVEDISQREKAKQLVRAFRRGYLSGSQTGDPTKPKDISR
jgi:hypothetical protein